MELRNGDDMDKAPSLKPDLNRANPWLHALNYRESFTIMPFPAKTTGITANISMGYWGVGLRANNYDESTLIIIMRPMASLTDC
jgi:hypothetical protein